MMKWPLFTLLVAALSAEAVEVGHTRAQVVAELGAPTSVMLIGNRETLTFGRGEVLLVDGRVRTFQIRTVEEQAALDYEREQAAAERARMDKERAAAREAREAAMIADPALRARPVSEQILVWRNAIESGRVLATSPQVAQHLGALADALRAEREAEANRARNTANSLGGVIAPTRLSLPTGSGAPVVIDMPSVAPVFPNTLDALLRGTRPPLSVQLRTGDTVPGTSLRLRTPLRSLADSVP